MMFKEVLSLLNALLRYTSEVNPFKAFTEGAALVVTIYGYAKGVGKVKVKTKTK